MDGTAPFSRYCAVSAAGPVVPQLHKLPRGHALQPRKVPSGVPCGSLARMRRHRVPERRARPRPARSHRPIPARGGCRAISGQVRLGQHAPFTGAHARRPHRARVVAIELVDLQAECHGQEAGAGSTFDVRAGYTSMTTAGQPDSCRSRAAALTMLDLALRHALPDIPVTAGLGGRPPAAPERPHPTDRSGLGPAE